MNMLGYEDLFAPAASHLPFSHPPNTNEQSAAIQGGQARNPP